MIQKKNIRITEMESKISNVLDTLEVIRDNLPSEFGGFAGMGLAKDGIYKKMEFAIESIIDICNIINSDLRLGMPETEDGLLDKLEKRILLARKRLG